MRGIHNITRRNSKPGGGFTILCPFHKGIPRMVHQSSPPLHHLLTYESKFEKDLDFCWSIKGSKVPPVRFFLIIEH